MNQAVQRLRAAGQRMSDAALKQLRRIQRKRVAYAQTFLNANGELHPNGHIVLQDLRRLAGIDKGGIVVSPVTRTVDPLATAYRAGQRDVYLRVVKMLGLDGAVTEDAADE